MNSTSTLLLAITAATLQFSGLARAEKIRLALVMDVKTHQSRSTFDLSKDHPGEDWLYLTAAHDDIEFNMRMSISGQKDVVQKGRTEVSEVPGVTEGVSGYKRARLEPFGNEVTLVIETKLTRKKKKDDKDVEEKEDRLERIPLQFKSRSGTLQDLKSGKTLEFLITSAGLKSILDRAKQNKMSALDLHAHGEGSRFSASGWSKLLDARQKGIVFVSAGRIQYEAPPTHVHAEGKAAVNDKSG
jgi:hypothetical protein